jgi:hypothetical protein
MYLLMYLIQLYLIQLYLIVYLIVYLIQLYLIQLYLIQLYISLSLNPSYVSFEPLVVNLSTYLAHFNPLSHTPFRRVAVQ